MYTRKINRNVLTDLPGEIWKDIKDFEGLYEISNFGRIRSVRYGNIEIRQQIKPNGYVKVTLSGRGKVKTIHTHTLVANAFIPNPDNKKEVNHKKGIKTDNRASELEWSDRVHNNKHSYSSLGRISTFLGKTGKLNSKSKPLIAVNIATNEEKHFESGHIAARELGIVQSLISDVLLGKQTKTHGYYFKYAQF